MLEAFCPMLGWTKMNPEYAIWIDPDFISGIRVESAGVTTPLFSSVSGGVGVLKSNGNAWQYNSGATLPFGGHAGPTALGAGGAGRPISQSGNMNLLSDNNYYTGSLNGHGGLQNYGLNSDFITVDRNSSMKITFKGPMKIKIFDKHANAMGGGAEVQTISITFPNSELPVPSLVGNDSVKVLGTQPPPETSQMVSYFSTTDSNGREVWHRSLEWPHWWCFNQAGVVGGRTGTINPNYFVDSKGIEHGSLYLDSGASAYSTITQAVHGRLDTNAGAIGADGKTPMNQGGTGYWTNVPLLPPEKIFPLSAWPGSDVVRTMVPNVAGDYRLIAALHNVPDTMWQPHPLWTLSATDPKVIHSFTDAYAGNEVGCKLPPLYPTNQNMQLVNGVLFGSDATDVKWTPDMPPSAAAAKDANRYGDFDTGIAGARNGPYLNKPDEGNFYIGEYTFNNKKSYYRSGYFYSPWNSTDDWRSGVYMSPNRLISSPVMFGSLPSAVWGGGPGKQPETNAKGQPWQTLLFRPYSKSNSQGGVEVSSGHPGDFNPRDHFLLDMFSMPVVEPYAISEPLSMAGRINLNYQIMPFTNIRRATGLHALMKGEYITAIPNSYTNKSKNFNPKAGNGTPVGINFWDDSPSSDGQFWHRPINVKETLVQFDEKFNGTASGVNHNITNLNGLFRSASQICEVHLIPQTDSSKGGGVSRGSNEPSVLTGLTSNSRQSVMDLFWQANTATGDNVRERPYSNLYNRITTRSNTFRVHVRAQTIKKARSSLPTTFDTTKDTVLSEYRGSTLIERYIDPNVRVNPLDSTDKTSAIPDYAATGNPLGEVPLESFYRFRSLESKRFNP